MALRFCDGFDQMTLADMTTYQKWDTVTGMSVGSNATHLRFGSGTGQYVLRANASHNLNKNFNSNEASGYFAFAMKITNTGEAQSVCFVSEGGTNQCGVALNTNREFFFYRNVVANIIGSASTYVLPNNTWVWVEWKWKVADSLSTAEMELKINGTAIITLNSGDSKQTANAYATAFGFGGPSTAVTGTYYDDFIWYDATGSQFNSYTGEIRIQSLLPTGDGNSSQFTGSDGNSTNNSLLVDESTPNGDTDYVQSQTVGHKDLYATADTITATNTIHAVVVNHVIKKTDTDAREIVAVIRTSGSDYDASANKVLSSGYINYQSIFELNPNGSIAWTKTTVDGAEYGLKVAV